MRKVLLLVSCPYAHAIVVGTAYHIGMGTNGKNSLWQIIIAKDEAFVIAAQ